MATRLYCRSSTTLAATTPGMPPDSGAYYDLLLTASGSDTFITNTVDGAVTPPGANNHVTKTAGGTPVTWVSAPQQAFTLAGTVTFGVRGAESNALANVAQVWGRVGKLAADGTYTWVASATTTAELTTSAASYTATVNPDDTAFIDGDRIVCEFYLDDAAATTMATGYTVTMTENTNLFLQVAEDIDPLVANQRTFHTTAVDGRVQCTSASYAEVLDGTGTLSTATDWLQCGQQYSAPNYFANQVFLPFDTSWLAAHGATPSGAPVLSVYVESDTSATDFTLEARAYDFGATVTTADYRTQTQFAALTLLASVATAGIATAVYTDLASEAALLAAVNPSGETRMVLASSRFRNGNTPTADERMTLAYQGAAPTRKSPKLIVLYTEPVVATPKGRGRFPVLRLVRGL